MNLYLLTQTVNDEYDSFDSCVVVAPDEESARLIHPANKLTDDGLMHQYPAICKHDWVSDLTQISVRCLGVAADDLVAGFPVCSSFNAG